MLAIKPWAWGHCDEELASISVRTCIGHAQETLNIMGELEIFVGKLRAINALPSPAIAHCEIPSLPADACQSSFLSSEVSAWHMKE